MNKIYCMNMIFIYIVYIYMYVCKFRDRENIQGLWEIIPEVPKKGQFRRHQSIPLPSSRSQKSGIGQKEQICCQFAGIEKGCLFKPIFSTYIMAHRSGDRLIPKQPL